MFAKPVAIGTAVTTPYVHVCTHPKAAPTLAQDVHTRIRSSSRHQVELLLQCTLSRLTRNFTSTITHDARYWIYLHYGWEKDKEQRNAAGDAGR
jgi:hypothetical protein